MRSNEDGFSRSDVRSICDIGESSKAGGQGYVGDKGIGFKSVFIAAHKVWIQSGDFSFYFEHRRGDEGLGMITPIWQTHDDDVPEGISQFTLYLHEDKPGSESTSPQDHIRNQFHNIHDDILLFMRNLKRIEVRFYESGENPVFGISHWIEQCNGSEIIAKKAQIDSEGDDHLLRNKRYVIVKHMARNVPAHENRVHSDEDTERNADSRSEIVLAFPLEPDSAPLVENQWVFAFLPIRQSGFKFLIQADFVTDVGRQDVVATSSRNKSIGVAIADAFIDAILQFDKEHEALRWTWMKYVPMQSDHAWDDFWVGVLEAIGERLRNTPVIQLDCAPRLQLLSKCSKHSPLLLDDKGQFLLPDQFSTSFASLRYHHRDLERLKLYGLKKPNLSDCIKLVKNDLQSPVSKFKTTEDADWHDRLAKILHKPFESGWKGSQTAVKELAIIPLANAADQWVPINLGPIHRAQVIDPQMPGLELSIPQGLGFNVIRPLVTGSIARKRLFETMGVRTASFDLVRERILQKYNCSNELDCGPIQPAHLNFLYQTHRAHHGEVLQRQVVNFEGNNGNSINPRLHDCYFPDLLESSIEEPTAAYEILKPVEPTDDSGHRAPGLKIDFISRTYFEQLADPRNRPIFLFKDWLSTHFQIRRSLRLVNADRSGLSEIAKYLAEYRPEKFIDFVQSEWFKQADWHGNSNKIVDQLRVMPVLCRGGSKRMLAHTFLPTQELRKLGERFMSDVEVFPWLYVESKFDRSSLPLYWGMFSTAIWPWPDGTELRNVAFVLDVLIELRSTYCNPADIPDPAQVYKLYIYLQAEVRRSKKPEKCRDRIQDLFRAHEVLLIPFDNHGERTWTIARDCVWDSPLTLRQTYSVARTYEQAYADFVTDKGALADFFTSTLKMRNSSWKTLVTEIRSHDVDSDAGLDGVLRIYELLADEAMLPDNELEFKEHFHNEALIVRIEGNTREWVTSSEFVWDEWTNFDKIPICGERRRKLGKFFRRIGVEQAKPTDRLDVPPLTIRSKAQPTTPEKQVMFNFSGDTNLPPAFRFDYQSSALFNPQPRIPSIAGLASRAAIDSSFQDVFLRNTHKRRKPKPRVRLPPTATIPVDPFRYEELLRRTVFAARLYDFPTLGANAATRSASVNLPRLANTLGSATGQARDFQIGAAGELFVFELLSHLKSPLPGFDRANWQSTLRHYAKAHPDYKDLTQWSGSETADITYMDEQSILTDLLIEKKYLEGSSWRGTKLKYFIEVKTTTGPCEQPFFLSTGQYERMQQTSRSVNGSIPPFTQRTAMYVIFRVFGLGGLDCGVRVLVDPENLRQRSQLTFSTASWSVVTKPIDRSDSAPVEPKREA